ncbi:hypothetical protein Tco_0304217 [Tanacetum coccineum]
MVTGMGIRLPKTHTLHGYSRLGDPAFTPRLLRSLSKPDRAHICTISGAIRGTCNNKSRSNQVCSIYTPLAYPASTSTNPDLMTSFAFVEANYEVLESLLREHKRKMRNEDLHTELENFKAEERAVEFLDAPNMDRSREERDTEVKRPSERRTKDNRHQGMNLPPLLASYMRRNENGQPLQSSLTSIQVGHRSSTNAG